MSTPKRVVVDMSASVIHHGHVRLLAKAKQLGHVIVALTTDEEIQKWKGYHPELSFEYRKEILLALRDVDEVVPSPWKLTDDFLREHKAELLVHAGPNFNEVHAVHTFDRTTDVSSTDMRKLAVDSIVQQRNSEKVLITPGPSNLHGENLFDLIPVFTRGDGEYSGREAAVLEKIRERAGQDAIVTLQGSATTGIEVATTNFLRGRVAVIVSGYYSERIVQMVARKADICRLQFVAIPYADVEAGSVDGTFDWIVAVFTETGDAFLTDLKKLRRLADRSGARLMIDATGSINLEDGHELADVCLFSSCKGLGGLAGAAFITYRKELLSHLNDCPKELILDISTYLEKKTTGPAHALCSLHSIADRFAEMGMRVRESKNEFVKRFSKHLYRQDHQPALCTKISGVELKYPPGVIGYQPRSLTPGSHVVCHLFEQFPSNRRIGEIYDRLVK